MPEDAHTPQDDTQHVLRGLHDRQGTPRGPWRVRAEHEVYRDAFVCLHVHDVLRPDGSEGTYAVVRSPDGFCAVPLTDDHQVYLVGQHRYAVDEFSWEVPTGGADGGEDPLEGAERELREETGLTAARWTPLGRVHPSGSVWASQSHLFLAQHLTKGESSPDPSERLQVRKVPLDEALRMSAEGEITHAATIVALYRTWRHLQEGAED
jgi:ADP-ribose pyrophosphatase